MTRFCLGTVLAVSLTLAQSGRYESGLRSFGKRDFEAAEREFGALLQRDALDTHAHQLLGMTLAAEEKYAEAIPHFAAACGDSRESGACYYLGRAQFATAHFEAAAASFEKERAVKRGAFSAKSLLGSGLAYEALGDAARAENFYRRAIAAGEGLAPVDYGLFLAKQGRYREGLALLEAAGAVREAAVVRREMAGAVDPNGVGEAAEIRFTATELPMVLRNGATGSNHLIETMAGGVAVLDFDQDGWPDLFFVNGASSPGLRKTDATFSNRLFRNRGDGSFEDVTEVAGLSGVGFGIGAAVGDFDNDGYPDLFVTGVDSNHLYRNRGDGTFEDVSERAGLKGSGKWSVGAGWFDFDNDGLLDLFVVRYVDWRPELDTFCGLPDHRQYCHPKQYPPLSNLLYRNLGNGRFEDVSVVSGIAGAAGKGMGVAFGDFDGDGQIDVFVTNDTVPNLLFHNEGKGRFHEVALEAGVAFGADGKALSSMGVDFRDYDNDGLEDLFVTALSDETFPLFRNLGNRHFADVGMSSGLARATPPYTGWSAGMFDFDNDGRKDLFAVGGHVMDNAEASSGRSTKQPALVFANLGGGRFRMTALPGVALHRGAAFADFDRDGRTDVVVTRLNQAPLVLWNRSPKTGHWLDVRLAGRKSTRDGLGAMVRVTGASGSQWNRAGTAVGYASSSDRLVHFGLGFAAVGCTVEVAWPSGMKSVLRLEEADRVVTIAEP